MLDWLTGGLGMGLAQQRDDMIEEEKRKRKMGLSDMQGSVSKMLSTARPQVPGLGAVSAAFGGLSGR